MNLRHLSHFLKGYDENQGQVSNYIKLSKNEADFAFI
jgi:hypothetical protein